MTKQLVLTVGYDIENLKGQSYKGEVVTDRYGRAIPKHAHGTENLEDYTASTKQIVSAALSLFDRIIDRKLLVRRLYLVAANVLPEGEAPVKEAEQMDLFTDYAAREEQQAQKEAAQAKERKMQETLLAVKKKYGKNAILKGMHLEEGATAKSRNAQIGGHKA